MQQTRVLCGVDESTGPLAAVRGLRAAGYEPWLALSQEHTYVGHSRAAAGAVRVPDPKVDPVGHASRVATEAKRLDVDVVLPCTEGTMRALAGHEEFFDRAVVGTCSGERLDRATDKALFVELCHEAGLETPPTVEVDANSLDRIDIELPAVLKPLRSVAPDDEGSLRTGQVTQITDRDSLRRKLETQPETTFLVQPFLPGTLAAICGVVWEGKVVCASHQVSPRIWPPDLGVSSFAQTVTPDEQRGAGVARLLELIGWSGVFGVQFMLVDEHAYAIDFNPRVYGSTALAIAAGYNLPAIWVELLLGRRPKVGAYRAGVRYRVLENDLRALAVEFHRGNRRAALKGLLPRGDTVHGVFWLRDPLPTLEIARRAVARFLP
jgi:predicted ATP-grasp superfamily ATP-dependent carboligase